MKDATPQLRPQTRYEVLLTGPAGERVVVSYTARATRAGLMAILDAYGEELMELVQDDRGDVVTRPRPAAVFANGWTLTITTTTERTAYTLRQEGN